MESKKSTFFKRDPFRYRENPCALCGWGKNMGIHTYPEKSNQHKPTGPHAYVPMEKNEQPPSP